MTQSKFKVFLIFALTLAPCFSWAQTGKTPKTYPVFPHSIEKSVTDKALLPRVTALENLILRCGLKDLHPNCLDKRWSSTGGGHLGNNSKFMKFEVVYDLGDPNETEEIKRIGEVFAFVFVRRSKIEKGPIEIYTAEGGLESIFQRKKEPVLVVTPETNPQKLRENISRSTDPFIQLTLQWALLGLENSDENRIELKTSTEKMLDLESARDLALEIFIAEFLKDLALLEKVETKFLSSDSPMSADEKQKLALVLAQGGVFSEAVLIQIRAHSQESESYSSREKAVRILDVNDPSEEGTLALLGALSDSDSDVGKAAVKALKLRPLSPHHLDLVRKALSSQDWSRRIEAYQILKQIDSLEALKLRISKVGDNDSDVSTLAFEDLEKTTMSEEVIVDLKSLFSNSSFSVRQRAVILLGKNLDKKAAAKAIIPAVADSDSDVSRTAFDTLTPLPMDAGVIADLQIVLKNTSWTVRKYAVVLLGLNSQTQSAATAIIPAVGDSDTDVQKAAFETLRTQNKLNPTHLSALAHLFESQSYTVRVNAVKLISTIIFEESLDILIEQLSKENDSDVKNALGIGIKTLRSKLRGK